MKQCCQATTITFLSVAAVAKNSQTETSVLENCEFEVYDEFLLYIYKKDNIKGKKPNKNKTEHEC